MLTFSPAGLQPCCTPGRNARCFLATASSIREASIYRSNASATCPPVGNLDASCRLLAPTAAADSCRSCRVGWNTRRSDDVRWASRRPAAATCQTWHTRCRQHAAVFAKHVGAPPARGRCNQKPITRQFEHGACRVLPTSTSIHGHRKLIISPLLTDRRCDSPLSRCGHRHRCPRRNSP